MEKVYAGRRAESLRIEARALVAVMEMQNHEANRDLTFGDGWKCDYSGLQNQILTDVRALLAEADALDEIGYVIKDSSVLTHHAA